MSGRPLRTLLPDLLFPSRTARRRLAARYLRGAGIEIGALHLPLETPPGVTVRYLDLVERAENVRRYPHLDPARIVGTDIIDDGFTLATVADSSQNFVVANHLLEHAPNPLLVLETWSRVLAAGGVLFLTLPDGTRNFDRGRPVTPLAHLVEDYDLERSGDREEIARRTREHCREFVAVSLANLNRLRRRRPLTPERQREYVEELVASGSTDPHLHVFDREAMDRLCSRFTTRHCPDIALQEIVPSRFGEEYVLILVKEG